MGRGGGQNLVGLRFMDDFRNCVVFKRVLRVLGGDRRSNNEFRLRAVAPLLRCGDGKIKMAVSCQRNRVLCVHKSSRLKKTTICRPGTLKTRRGNSEAAVIISKQEAVLFLR